MSQLLRLSRLALLVLAFGLFLVQPVWAQDDDDDDDDEDIEEPEDDERSDTPEEEEGDVKSDEEERAERERARRADIDSQPEDEARSRAGTRKRKARANREVVKGAYLKMNVGPIFWLPPISYSTTTSGTELDFSFGYDVIDRLPFTLTVEASFTTVITNGTGINDNESFRALLDAQITPTIQGDFRVFGGTVNLRLGPNFGGRKTKRVSFCVQVGGGGGYSPPLIDLQDQEIKNRAAANGLGFIMQGRFLGLITPGLGIEYYTKLSHFSLGLDVDATIILGGPSAAIGVGTEFFAKYTF